MPAHTNTTAAAMSSTILRSPNDLVRTLPATVNALLCLMLRRFQKRARRCRLYQMVFQRLPHLWGSTRRSRGMGLGLLPTSTLLRLIDVGEGLALAAQGGLGSGEARAKSLARDTESILRVHLQAPRQ